MPQIDKLFQRMNEVGASDLHLRVGTEPRFRIDGDLVREQQMKPLTAEIITHLVRGILTPDQLECLERRKELDFAYGNPTLGRFRCNYFHDHWGPAVVFRSIPAKVPSLSQLGLPSSLNDFAHMHRGMVLVTGATGSGKTSTQAAIIDAINDQYRKHIITLEDPIEFLHTPKRSIIHQRGMHYDIVDFETGIIDATREDPDVLLIGELRDLESIRRALTAAELGMLVFATLHTNGATDSIDRIIDVFPPSEQPQVRTMLSQCLAGIISQVLLPRRDVGGRVPATEVLISTPAVSNIIREGKTQDLANVMQSGRSHGMHTLDDALRDLVVSNIVDPRDAFLHAHNKSIFEKALEQRPRRPVPSRAGS